MNYKVLYRKYRPDNFENIIGQEYIIKILKNSIINNNISHAYIFSGPRGTGKTSTAKVFAKAINCLKPIDGSPCGECEFCKNYNENPDIIEIDAASNNGVDDIRNLIDNIKLTPSNGKYKIYIIDEVHMLTISAFNALLLTLEEPPAHAIFILATTNVENIPITIKSRCQRFDFQKISVENIVKSLKNICNIENIEITEDALEEISYLSEGGMRDALSLLDQLSKNKEKITLDLIEKEIKTISKKVINDLIESIEKNDLKNILEILNDLKNRNNDYKTLIKKLIDGLSINARKIKETKKIKRMSFIDYKNLIIELNDSLNRVNINVDSYIILEMILLSYLNIEESKKEKNSKVELIENPIKIENKIDVYTRINNCFYGAKKELLENIKKEFSKITNSVTIDGKVKSILLDSTVVVASDKYLILSCDDEANAKIGNNNIDLIEKNIEKEIHKNYKIVFLDNKRWNIEKEKYINNIKNGIKYQYIEEKFEEKEDNSEINDIFNNIKVEVI